MGPGWPCLLYNAWCCVFFFYLSRAGCDGLALSCAIALTDTWAIVLSLRRAHTDSVDAALSCADSCAVLHAHGRTLTVADSNAIGIAFELAYAIRHTLAFVVALAHPHDRPHSTAITSPLARAYSPTEVQHACKRAQAHACW